MKFLSKSQIIQINHHQVETFGGNFVLPDNLLHENRLNYLVEAVDMEVFGQPLYPEICHKTGLYMFNTVANHIFSDGNKRTGLQAALIFLISNGFRLLPQVTDQILIDFATEVASGKHTLESVQAWFANNITKIS